MNQPRESKILLVNDDEIGRYAIGRVLRQAGFEVIEAATGGEGLELLSTRPDLVLLDVNLPDISGFEISRRIKSDPETAHIPVLHVSATFIDAESQVRGLESGADGYLTYPLEPPVLIATVRAHLRLREAEVERQRLVEELRQLNAELEQRVADRTRELVTANRLLTSRGNELEALAYSISHDVRAPLRGIDGFSMVLNEDYGDRLDEAGRGYLERIRSAAKLMGELIDHLLALSRLSRREATAERVDLTALAREVMSDLVDARPEIDVEFSVEEGLTVVADEDLLRTLVTHLLDNAIKFSEPDGIARIQMGTAEHAGETAFFVRDDGVGFDMQYAGKLFTAFQHLHPTSTFPGAGIGLATVRRVVHRHGGQVWAEASPGKGATFWFTLPHAPDSHAATEPDDEVAKAQ